MTEDHISSPKGREVAVFFLSTQIMYLKAHLSTINHQPSTINPSTHQPINPSTINYQNAQFFIFWDYLCFKSDFLQQANDEHSAST